MKKRDYRSEDGTRIPRILSLWNPWNPERDGFVPVWNRNNGAGKRNARNIRNKEGKRLSLVCGRRVEGIIEGMVNGVVSPKGRRVKFGREH